MTRRRKATASSDRLFWALGASVAAALFVINSAVAFLGHSVVFPLSPFHLGDKLSALQRYARHRPFCLFEGHPQLSDHIRAAEDRYNLPPGLLQAVVETESAGEPHRISPAGAMGLTQLIPSTARMLNVRDPFDSDASLDAGARYLSQLLREFRDVHLAVAAYNAGPGNVVGRAVPHNGETERYVVKVMTRYAQLAPAELRASVRARNARPRPPTSRSFRPSARGP